MNTALWSLIVGLVTWTLTNAYWADRNEADINELWISFYNETNRYKQQKEQPLDRCKEQKHELNIIHTNKGEASGDYPRPNAE